MGIEENKGIEIRVNSFKCDFKTISENGYKYALLEHSESTKQNINFEYNYSNALENGLQVGLFHLSKAENVNEVKIECDRISKLLNKYPSTLPTGIRLHDIAKRKIELQTELGSYNYEFTKQLEIYMSFVPYIKNDVMFYIRHEQTLLENFNLVKNILPLWYYRNTKKFDGTNCLIWQKRLSDTIPGVQGKAGVFYKI